MPDTESDLSVSPGQFEAFQQRGGDLPPAWRMKATGTKIGALAAIVVVVAALAAVLGTLLVG